MSRPISWMFVAALLLSAPGRAEEAGTVTLPVTRWEQMLDELKAGAEDKPPPLAVAPLSRSIEGGFRKGLLSATLRARFEVFGEPRHIRVPVLDAAASVGEVLLDGKKTSLLSEGGMYTVGVNQPGVHEVRLQFYWGQEQDRFARSLRFRVPRAGPTSISVLVPEEEIEPRLANGALEPAKRVTGGTMLLGHIDASGLVDLSWSRQLTHKQRTTVRSQARVHTLFTLGEALVTGLAVIDLDILEGETDRVDLRLPGNVEVLAVEGDAVLQWHTEAQEGGRLGVLLRYLVDERARVAVRFQFPVESVDKPVQLRMPLPTAETPMAGYIGVLAPTGLKVDKATVEAAQELTLRDLPPELTELTQSPLLFGFAFEAAPQIALSLARHHEVELTSTIIDELQASTVVVEDGTEITKLKLRIRNNTRQYLAVAMPPGAVLTHSLIDGTPVRPAVRSTEGEHGGESLLLPLRQSERIGAEGSRAHTVRSGETLSDIANANYADPSGWGRILDNNRDQLASPEDLYPGQVLRIPALQGATFDESAFVIELAYKQQRRALGSVGRHAMTLPALDVDTVKVVWHLYLPSALEPLAFKANLTQYSDIRYDPFRRALQFLERARFISHAWAGGRYKSILSQRKSIWAAETRKRQAGSAVLASFPLVGERFRFKRILPGKEQPAITVSYVDKTALPPLRWLALLASFVVVSLVLRAPRSRDAWILAAVVLALLLLLAHYVLGVHRRLVWGADLALLLAWGQLRAGPLLRKAWNELREPWKWASEISLGNFFVLLALCFFAWLVLAFPLLLSSFAFVLLIWAWRRAVRASAKEVQNA